MQRGFVRKIIRVGDSEAITLPVPLLEGMTWGRGDYLYIEVLDTRTIKIARFLPHEVSDEVRKLADQLPVVPYGR